jgi:hypothetical protein
MTMEKRIFPIVMMVVLMLVLKGPLIDSNFESPSMRVIGTGMLAGASFFLGALVQRFVFRVK